MEDFTRSFSWSLRLHHTLYLVCNPALFVPFMRLPLQPKTEYCGFQGALLCGMLQEAWSFCRRLRGMNTSRAWQLLGVHPPGGRGVDNNRSGVPRNPVAYPKKVECEA